MKRLAFIVLAILLFPALCLAQDAYWQEARMNPYVAGVVTAVACDPGTNEVGNRNASQASFQTLGLDSVACIRSQADCAGNLASAYLHEHAITNSVKVCVYTSTDTSPAAADALVGCSNVITPIVDSWATATMAGTYGVTKDSYYWTCVLGSGEDYVHVDAGTNDYIKTITGSYASPPANLETGFGVNSNRFLSIYVSLGP